MPQNTHEECPDKNKVGFCQRCCETHHGINPHDTLREEFRKEFYGQGMTMHVLVVMSDWWLSKFTTHDQEQLEGLIEAVGEEIQQDERDFEDDYDGQMEAYEIKGQKEERQRIRNLLTSRLSNIKK